MKKLVALIVVLGVGIAGSSSAEAKEATLTDLCKASFSAEKVVETFLICAVPFLMARDDVAVISAAIGKCGDEFFSQMDPLFRDLDVPADMLNNEGVADGEIKKAFDLVTSKTKEVQTLLAALTLEDMQQVFQAIEIVLEKGVIALAQRTCQR